MLHTNNKNRRLIMEAGSYLLFALAITVMFSSTAYAQVTIGDTLCAVYGILQTNVGRGLATLAIASLGIGAMLGKVSWGMAVLVGVGIAGLFGADTIFVTIMGSTYNHC